jgi:hypothetical protein
MNQPGGTASIGMNLKISNGQTASITTKGNFTYFDGSARMRMAESASSLLARAALACYSNADGRRKNQFPHPPAWP